MKPDEHAFESFICEWLVEHSGYDACKVGTAQGEPTDFDPVRGLDTLELWTFIGTTHADTWEELTKRLGGDDDAMAKFADRVASEIDKRGTVDVLRHGMMDHGITIRMAYFKPAHGLTPELVAKHKANRLTVTRQLPYEAGSSKTLDLALFIKGVPVATTELKNALTGQSVEHAIGQYRTDRDPANRTLGKRARFLRFNRGHGRGGGNPVGCQKSITSPSTGSRAASVP